MAKADVLANVEKIKADAHSNLESFLHMLDTISKFHKYNFDQQASLSFYAGAGYAAVAEEQIWAKYFHANIKPDANAIELLDANAPDGVKVVYDVSDTDVSEERRQKLLWKFVPERDNGVFRGIADEGATPMDSILQTCWNLEKIFSGTDYSGEEIMLVSECVGYVLMKRLGFESEAESLADYTISDEMIRGTHISLGDVSNISREILNGIQDYVQRGKGRGEDCPLRETMSRVQDIISLHWSESQEKQQGNASEASAAPAADVTKEAAEAVASVEAPAAGAAADGFSPGVASPVFEQASLFDDFSSATGASGSSAAQEAPVEPAVSGPDPSVAEKEEVVLAPDFIDASMFYLSRDGYVSSSNPDRECRVRLFLYNDQSLGCIFETREKSTTLRFDNIRDAYNESYGLAAEFVPGIDPSAFAFAVVENYRSMVNHEPFRYAYPAGLNVNAFHAMSEEDYASLGIDAPSSDIPAAGVGTEPVEPLPDETSAGNQEEEKTAESVVPDPAVRAGISQEDVSAEAFETTPADAEAIASIATENNSSPANDYLRNVVDSRVYYISSDGKRSNKPKPSMIRIDVSLRDDGAAYIDIATRNRYSGGGLLADDPQEAYNFALRTPLVQDFNAKVVADAILSDYQEMMRQHNISVPSVLDQQRFDVSPDGVSILDHVYDVENDRWVSSGSSPDNYIRFDMRYMSNGRVDVGLTDSVTGRSRNFTDYDNLFNSVRAIVADIVPDSNAEMIANWAVQHAVLMERIAKQDNQQENALVEATASEAAAATQEAAEPEGAVASAEAPAVDPATDGSSVAADDFDDSISVEEYFKLAGVQVIPDWRRNEILSHWEEKRANNDASDHGKFVVIDGIDIESGNLSFTAISNDGVPVVTETDDQDFALHTLGVNMEAFRDALARFDGTNLEEVALPSNNPPFSWPSRNEGEELPDSPFMSAGASSDWPDQTETHQEEKTAESAAANPAPTGEIPLAPEEANAPVEAVSVVSDMHIPLYHHNRYEWGVIAAPNAISDDTNILMQLMSDDSVKVHISSAFLGDSDVSFDAKDISELRTKSRELFNALNESYAGLTGLFVNRYEFLRKQAYRGAIIADNELQPLLLGYQQHAISPSGEYVDVSRVEDNDVVFQMYLRSNGELDVTLRRGDGEETAFTAVGWDDVFNQGKAAFAKLLPDSNATILASAIGGNFRTMIRSSEVPEFFNAPSEQEVSAQENSDFGGGSVAEENIASPSDFLDNSSALEGDSTGISDDVDAQIDSDKDQDNKKTAADGGENSSNEELSISSDGVKYHGGRKGEAFQRNIKAIQTLKTLESENRPIADKMEEYALLDYSGFGNLPEVFDEGNESWKPERDLLKSVLTNEEYISSRSSVLSAFYTDSDIISAIYNGISHMGFKNGNILEPSCGSGNFFYDMPGDMREKSHLFGVELDPISGRIARQLHPDANISIQGFETTTFPDGSFDLAITNVPFENYKIQGRSVHDFFLVKMAQQIRPGGLMVAITSRYSMDKRDSSAREDLARNAELVKAIRLPNTAFRNAGTDATTDILVFRRREKALGFSDPLPKWVESVPFEGNSPDATKSIFVNPYFVDHPEDVLGTLDKKSTAYGFDLTCKPKENASENIFADISNALSTVRVEYIPLPNPLPVPKQAQSDNSAVYSFFMRGDEVLFRGASSYDERSLSDAGIDEKDAPQIKHLIRIRDLTREVIRSQQFTDNDEALRLAQERLSSVYQDYVEAYGNLHAKKVKQIFEEDCSYPLLLSLENTDEKGKVVSLNDIFAKRTIRPHIPPAHVDTAQEALIVSMTEHGKVDLDYMERLTGIGRENLVSELEYKELFWDQRSDTYLSADEYLSGDIREKIEWLETQEKFALRQRDSIVWDELIPPDVPAEDYVSKNDTEERILSRQTTYSFTSDATEYFEESADRDFCFAFLESNDGGFYRLPERFTSDPNFCLEAALRFGDSVDSNDSALLIANIVEAMKIDGLGDLTSPSWRLPVLDFLGNGTEEEYPQKRACVNYLRQLLQQYDGSNGDILVARAANEWPFVWQGWQEKFNTLVKQNELLGLPKWNQDLERDRKKLEALRAVCPKDLEASDISVRLGAPWIPPQYIHEFMLDTFDLQLDVEYSDVHHGQWKIVSARSDYAQRSGKASEYSTPTFTAPALLEKILNLQPAIARDTVIIGGKEKEVINQEKTVLAQQKQELIKEAFAKWIWEDEERKDWIVKYYNRHFNNIRPREFDGSHLEFPGMNPEIQLRPHQKDAIAHTLYGGNTLLAHCVGAGKSFEMIASIMESKRLGLCNKAMMVVPGHLTEQMGAEFMRLYPMANILVATKKDFEKANRKEFCAKIATHNWDAIILGFTQFEKVAMSKEYVERFTQDELSRLMAEIEIAKEREGKSFSVRQMERQRKSLESKLISLRNTKPKDDVVNFEDLGIDRLYVDEAHNFKNLGVITKLQRMPGIATESAQKSTDFYQKVQYINKKTNCKGLVFATGTAISNSMTELYTMQQYLQPDRLEHEGIRHFDTWATTFGEISNVQEITPEGKGIRLRQRFSRFSNLPELMSLVKEFADIKTEDMLNLPTPEVKYHVENVPASSEQKAMVDALAERAVGIRNKTVDTSLPQNNMLSVTNEGRKVALDQRIMNPDLPDYPDSKVNRCVGNVFRIWEDTKKSKGTQLVFSDFSTPDDDKFNVYDDIKKKLVAKGVPENEIAFIHDATNEKQKEALFEKVRKGQVRVLLGSTSKLGTGTNVQDKLVASHDLDVPWRPSDLEQRKGRIARQGNENKNVEVYRYVTEGTFDSYMWQMLENKQRFISQILTSKSPARVTEDMDELVLSCAEIKAIATGSPLIREKMDLDVEVERLKIARKGFLSEQASRKYFIETSGAQHIDSCKKGKALAESDVRVLDSFVPPSDGTLIVLGGKSFTDAKEAGEAIVKAIRAGHGEELTGSYKGMKFKLFPGFNWKMELVGSMTYSEDVHMGSFAENMKRLEKIEERIRAYPAKMDEEIQNTQKKIDEAREIYGKPFAREDEYQQKMLRLQELTVLLSEDNNKDKAEVEKEEARRLDNLSVICGEGEGLESYYADFVLNHMEEDIPWSEELEQKVAENCLRRGYSVDNVMEVILKNSPKVYNAAVVDRIVSNANVKANGSAVAACRC